MFLPGFPVSGSVMLVISKTFTLTELLDDVVSITRHPQHSMFPQAPRRLHFQEWSDFQIDQRYSLRLLLWQAANPYIPLIARVPKTDLRGCWWKLLLLAFPARH